jgi:hypothetical protein
LADSIEKKFEGIPRNKRKWREVSKKVNFETCEK